MPNAVNWFEIPVKDFKRAKQFYTTILGKEVTEMPMPDNTLYGVLPYDQNNNGVGGAIIQSHEDMEPSSKGTMVYLNGGEDLNVPLAKIEKAGGKILLPKTSIGENGFMAHFVDTEGNKLALHSMK